MKKSLPKHIKNTIAIDLDGTLLDNSSRQKNLLDSILSDLKIKINTEDYLLAKSEGISTRQYLLSKNIDSKTVELIVKNWIKNVENHKLLKLDKLYSDTIKFLRAIHKKYNLILVTARSNRKNSKNQIKNLKISKYFKKIFIVKNNAFVVENKIKKIKKYNCIAIIGDSEVEKNVAKTLKIKFYGLNRGLRSERFFNECNIKTYSSLLDIKSL